MPAERSPRAISGAGHFLAWLAFAPPAILLVWLGLAIGADGLALDAAVPVPSYMVAGMKVPLSAYRDTAEALAAANPADGDAHVMRGEALMMAGAPAGTVEAQLADGLVRAPANARGWTLLAEVRAGTRPAAVSRALGNALMLAPYDFYLAGRRLRDAALFWPDLDPETRRSAQRQAALLSGDPVLRPQYDALMATSLKPRIQSMIIQNVLVPDMTISVGH